MTEEEHDAKLRAEAQALREEVAEYEALCNRQAELLSQSIVAIRGPEPELTRWGYADLPLRVKTIVEEVAALRARVVVVPERKLLNAGVPGLNRNSGWNDCLNELARLNGKTVSEGLLREVARHLGNWLELHECECDGGFHYCGRDQVAKTNRELRALLNQDKENGNG
ncbi:hypothetical protein [Pseudomonas aeruginosa]|uniref:hypothetical protein n=1 Tax=Pseudomonas aeruginosa TaxID=287 RepID=UPI001D55221B|nr:hypothetical protein [Pseudomonas aeruginosa]MBN0305290.1 hypothetical protein [Pseudomonas aeruginosa]MBN0383601.1 hypothetical protein [Pseudomonas aeruginosa]MBN0441908.1 hypothetical protein [Pseudomonas aeruginosa]MBN0512504.1 hypothetical protein [Pseudomonas aeruginosa]